MGFTRWLNHIILYINLYLSTISRLLVMSVISSGTLNNIRSPTYITHIILYHQRTLSVRTLRVWELCRHDRETSPVNNQYRNLNAHIGSYIYYEDLYRSNRITTNVLPFIIGMLLDRDSIVGILIPSSISLWGSLFTHSVMHHPINNSLFTLLARLIVMCITERARDVIPLIKWQLMSMARKLNHLWSNELVK